MLDAFSREEAWIFDMDGTLANSKWRQHHLMDGNKDWTGWNTGMIKDLPNHEIIQFTHIAREKNIAVIVCTGREDTYRKDTEDWLQLHSVSYDMLFMRKAKDYRKDQFVKKEMLDAIKFLNYNPTLSFDDRDRVVKMWREEGIRCFQVDYGDF
jgi:hydroxymethylpyrimidine pyrophosphatase-like HAD family hydrolase